MAGHALTGLATLAAAAWIASSPCPSRAPRSQRQRSEDRSSSSAASCPTGQLSPCRSLDPRHWTRSSRLPDLPARLRRSRGRGVVARPGRGSSLSRVRGPSRRLCGPPPLPTATRGVGSRQPPRSEPPQPPRRPPTERACVVGGTTRTASRRGPLTSHLETLRWRLVRGPRHASTSPQQRFEAASTRSIGSPLRRQPQNDQGLRSPQGSLEDLPDVPDAAAEPAPRRSCGRIVSVGRIRPAEQTPRSRSSRHSQRIDAASGHASHHSLWVPPLGGSSLGHHQRPRASA